MKFNPLISIIIPVYNGEKYIKRALDSLINQTYKNIEILCINDGSEDDSLEIIKYISKNDSRIKVFSQENSGPAKSRNKGLENAAGEYIMFCDTDDYYEYNMCELMLQSMLEKNVDIVMCDCNIVNTYNTNLRNIKEFEYFKIKLIDIYNIGIYEYLLLNSMLWNKIFKKTIIDLYNITFIDGYEHDDTNFFYKYLSCSNNYYGLNSKLYNYEISNNNSIMSLYYTNRIDNNKKLDFLYSYHNLIEFIIKNKSRSQVIHSIIKLYEEGILSFARYLNKEYLIKMIQLQKNFFKDKYQFDDFDYIKEIKYSNIKKCMKRFNIKLTFLEWIFSIKNKSFYEKVITIFGISLFIKIYKNVN
ncbi:glycosyltransferase family 2 protein [Brachyspira murdochii]|uniref:glycosyltransferase family 2 protein n=1 Tax=Brachyspira murdochii TaxID=84378 RepID=UPI001E40879F|nr:glycosyltransferase family A protein [Brachyspira murdochii]